MRIPYGENKEYFKYSLFLVFCNRISTSAVSAGVLLVRSYHWQNFYMVLIGHFALQFDVYSEKQENAESIQN